MKKQLHQFYLLLTALILILPLPNGISVGASTEEASEASSEVVYEAVVHDPVYPKDYPSTYAEWVTRNHFLREAEDNRIYRLNERIAKFQHPNKQSADSGSESGVTEETSESPTFKLQFTPATEALDNDLYQFNQQFGPGQDKGLPKNSMAIDGFVIPFEDMTRTTGHGDDFTRLMELLDANLAVRVGRNNITTLFGHYYNLSDNGVFNPLHDQGLLNVDTEVIITDDQGLSKGYRITQILRFNHADQQVQFYGQDYMPYLAYHGNDSDMLYIQYCRWDIELGLLITNLGYRIW